MNKNDNKKVTIVLPVYNGEKVLNDAIESVLAQTYLNFELLVVNDCSTDQTESIIDRYVERDTRVKKINNIQNLKLPATLNAGFQNATGEYWTWTSDDNKYKPEAIECMVKYLDNNLSCCMVYTDYTAIDAEGNELFKQVVGEPKELAMGNCIGACFLYRREYAQKVGKYDINLFLAEDYDYWVRLCKAGSIHHLSKNLYYYRRHSNSLTSTRKEMIEIQTCKVWEKNFLYLFSMLDSHKQRILFLDRMYFCVKRLDEQEGAKIAEMLCKVYPRYEWHLRYLEIRHVIGKTMIGDAWKKICGR